MSNVDYDGSHSINFITSSSTYNSWTDFHLIPAKRPEIADPQPNLHSVAIPGTDRRIDITRTLPEGLTYGLRQGQWEFYIDHDQWDSWSEAYRTLANHINGQRMTISLGDQQTIGYDGRLQIKGYRADGSYSSVTIEYMLEGRSIRMELIPKTITENGRYDPKGDGAIGYSDVVVNVETEADLGEKKYYE